MTEQVLIGQNEARSAFTMVERNLRSAVSFMNSHGLLHFDLHFNNILTDSNRIYISDFGLATCSRFELSEPELEFFELNKAHDGCYVVTQLVNWLVTALTGVVERQDRIDFIRRCADGFEPAEVFGSAAKLIKRYAPVAAVMNDFYTHLRSESRSTPFPFDEIKRISGITGFDPMSDDSSI